jgi:hypothetical protein
MRQKLIIDVKELLEATGMDIVLEKHEERISEMSFPLSDDDMKDIMEEYGISDDNYTFVERAIDAGWEDGTKKSLLNSIEGVLGGMLDDFYQYDYDYTIPEETPVPEAEKEFTGTSHGFLSLRIDWSSGKAEIEVDEDFGHVINDVLYHEADVWPEISGSDYTESQMQEEFLDVVRAHNFKHVPEVEYSAEFDKKEMKRWLREDGLIK